MSKAGVEPTVPDAMAPVEGGDERCPECDAAVDWQTSRRHRYSPFGAVLLTVLAFWTAVLGWSFGFGFLPSMGLFAAAVVIGSATRKAEICVNCGFVRRSRR